MSTILSKPRLLDAFCGAGGCTRGYQEAGFYVVGVDVKPQSRYIGDEFYQGDALEFIAKHGADFDVIHTSPPCQAYSVTEPMKRSVRKIKEHPELIEPTRAALQKTGKLYIIENVPGAPLINPLMLCGTMFNLKVFRHRLFETNIPIFWPPFSCNHNGKIAPSKGKYHSLDGYDFITCAGHDFQVDAGKVAMKIDWMTRDEMAQAIPPAYTRWIGERIVEILEQEQPNA